MPNKKSSVKYEKKEDYTPNDQNSPSKKSQGTSKSKQSKSRKGWDDEEEEQDLNIYIEKPDLTKSQPINLSSHAAISPINESSVNFKSNMTTSTVFTRKEERKLTIDEEDGEVIYEKKGSTSTSNKGATKNDKKEKRSNKKDIQIKENPLRSGNSRYEYVAKTPSGTNQRTDTIESESEREGSAYQSDAQSFNTAKTNNRKDESLVQSIDFSRDRHLVSEPTPLTDKEERYYSDLRIQTQEDSPDMKDQVESLSEIKNTQSEEKLPSQVYLDKNANIEVMEIREAFEQLTHDEKMYAYYMTRASWAGLKIAYFQRSYESPALLYLATKIFILESIEGVKQRLTHSGGWSNEEWEELLLYFCVFYHNCGNYLTSGSTKFIPRVPKGKFEQFILGSLLAQRQGCMVNHIWNEISHEVYAAEAPFQMLGLLENGGLSGFYSPGITRKEIKYVNDILLREKISPINTRVLRPAPKHYQILIASSVFTPFPDRSFIDGDCKIDIFSKDFGMTLNDVVDNLRKAQNFVANESQFRMIGEYIRHIITGDIEAHKNAQRYWLQDKNPVVEANLGFTELYLDPASTRAEWEGLVALADKKQAALLENFVQNAGKYVKLLPWGDAFERETFIRPDFTPLKFLSFASSAMYDGINLPNYFDITQVEGSKNLQFENVKFEELASSCTREYLSNYLPQEAAEVYWNHNRALKNSRVTIHEILGHGSGKHLVEDETGKKNFIPEKTLLPNGQKVQSWYKNGQTAHGFFGDLYGAMEECRADTVSIYLSCFDDVLSGLFTQIKNPEILDEIRYATWLDVCLGGLRSIELFNFESMKWGQSHRQGWYVILNVLLNEGKGVVELKKEADGKTRVHLDRSKILTSGKEAIREFLTSLQIGMATSDHEFGEKFRRLSEMKENSRELRNELVAIKPPMNLTLQPEMVLRGDTVELVEYPRTKEGMIKSYLDHFQHNVDEIDAAFCRSRKLMKYHP